MAYKYMFTHGDSLSWTHQWNVQFDKERSPKGHNSVWLECEKGVGRVKALEKVKNIIEEGDSVAVTFWPTSENKSDDDFEAAEEFCDRHGWIWDNDDKTNIPGSEFEVRLLGSSIGLIIIFHYRCQLLWIMVIMNS